MVRFYPRFLTVNRSFTLEMWLWVLYFEDLPAKIYSAVGSNGAGSILVTLETTRSLSCQVMSGRESVKVFSMRRVDTMWMHIACVCDRDQKVGPIPSAMG